MTIPPISNAGLPLMIAAGAAVGLAAVLLAGPEFGAAGLIVIVAARSLLVVLQGVLLVGMVEQAGRQVQTA